MSHYRKLSAFDVDIFKTGTSGARWDILTARRFTRKKYLESYGYKVYSQNDEDGMIQEIFHRIGATTKTFIEFGVENGLECNTHFLLIQGWHGLWIEGSSRHCQDMKKRFAPVIQNGQLRCVNEIITKDNINEIFVRNGWKGTVDLLSIDIDGNDYQVWEAIKAVRPRVVIIEYNAKFPPGCDWVMPYNEYHIWDGSDRQGASLSAMVRLAEQKGYQLVGTGINGINAFFVKKHLCGRKFPLPATAENLYNPMRFVSMNFISGHPANKYVASKVGGLAGEFLYEDENTVFLGGFGFHKSEMDEIGKFSVQWTKEKKCMFFVRNIMQNTIQMKISYLSLEGDVTVRISCRNHILLDTKAVAQRGELTVPLPSEKQEIMIFELSTDKLYTVDHVLHNGDLRVVGIGICSVSLTERQSIEK